MLNRPFRLVLCIVFLIFQNGCGKQVPPANVPTSPEPHQHHKDVVIPTPLAELKEAPLDLIPICEMSGDCSVLFLYTDRLELFDWKTGTTKKEPISKPVALRSRAPSGKLIKSGSGYWVLHNNYAEPFCINKDLKACENQTVAPSNFPRAFPGTNFFFLSDGKFFDLQLDSQKMIVIETNQHLSIAETGRRFTSQEKVGGCMTVSLPVIYTSSPTLPEEADSIQKFRVEQDAILLETTRPVLGQILDLEVSDLNQDGVSELLVTVKNPNGIFIQVFDVF